MSDLNLLSYQCGRIDVLVPQIAWWRPLLTNMNSFVAVFHDAGFLAREDLCDLKWASI